MIDNILMIYFFIIIFTFFHSLPWATETQEATQFLNRKWVFWVKSILPKNKDQMTNFALTPDKNWLLARNYLSVLFKVKQRVQLKLFPESKSKSNMRACWWPSEKYHD